MGDIITEFKIENLDRPNKAIVYPFALVLLISFGFLSSIGEYCLILAYKNDRALFLTPLFYLCLVWSTLYGFFFFNELPDIFSIIGTLMLVSAGLLSFYFKKNNLKKN